MDIFKAYGLKPMTLEEEANAPENIKRLRECKMNIIDRCAHIKRLTDQIENTAKGILEKDDEKYAELVEAYYHEVNSAEKALSRAINIQYVREMSREVGVVDVLLRDLPEWGSKSKIGIWQDGTKILCRSQLASYHIVDLIKSCGVDAHVGYYNWPEKDDEADEEFTCYGYWYVDFD